MNLKDEPTQAQLMQIIASCNDKFKHVLWVSTDGEVGLLVLKPDDSPALSIMQKKNVQFWVESIPAGQGKVGIKASVDKKWITKLFHVLVANWEKGKSGFAAWT